MVTGAAGAGSAAATLHHPDAACVRCRLAGFKAAPAPSTPVAEGTLVDVEKAEQISRKKT